MASRAAVLALAALAALAACDDEGQGSNGSPCLKNADCASDRCVATLCQPKPAFGAEADAGADAAND